MYFLVLMYCYIPLFITFLVFMFYSALKFLAGETIE